MNSPETNTTPRELSTSPITLNVPLPNSHDERPNNNLCDTEYSKQNTSTIRNARRLKSTTYEKFSNQRIMFQQSVKSERSWFQIPKTSLSMHGKLELTAFNKQPIVCNEMHDHKGYPGAFKSSFGIRQSSPSRIRVYSGFYSANMRGIYNPTGYRRLGIISPMSTQRFTTSETFIDKSSAAGVTVVDLANSAQCLIVNSLKTPDSKLKQEFSDSAANMLHLTPH
ncbi:unnamed protein product [Trichobilharzia regenti]|nr:unnamed protein product [Trichobilharzia regenti]